MRASLSNHQAATVMQLAISGNATIILPIMTVLIGYLDTDTGESALIADGRASKKGTCAFADEWKTVQLNGAVAVGFAGDVSWGNQLIARLFKDRELQMKGPNVRVVRVLEAARARRSDLDWESAKREISHEIALLLKVENEPFLTVMAAGLDNRIPRLAIWHRNYKWEAADLSPKTGLSIAKACAGPTGKVADTSVLEDTSLSLTRRARLAVRTYAEEFPDSVNEYTTIRRATRGFKLEILSKPEAKSND